MKFKHLCCIILLISLSTSICSGCGVDKKNILINQAIKEINRSITQTDNQKSSIFQYLDTYESNEYEFIQYNSTYSDSLMNIYGRVNLYFIFNKNSGVFVGIKLLSDDYLADPYRSVQININFMKLFNLTEDEVNLYFNMKAFQEKEIGRYYSSEQKDYLEHCHFYFIKKEFKEQLELFQAIKEIN